jgi:hypothetical protein
MAFDPRRGVMVLFGGQHGTRALGDTWLWDGRRWTQVPPSDDDPARRGHHVMAWDARRQRVVMYGGGYLDGDQYRRHDDWWSWSGSRWERLRWPLQAELLAQRRILRAQAPGPGVEGVVGRLRQRQPRQPAATAPPRRGTGGGRGTAKGRRAERGGPTST